MKKVYVLALTLLCLIAKTNAQIIFEDDFETYTNGAYVALSSPNWTTWSNSPGSVEDAVISNTYSNSPTQSMHISGQNDMVLPLGNQTSGQFWVNFLIYVPTGDSEGYYNIQHIDPIGAEWALECNFNNNGTGHLDVDGGSYNFNYTKGAWVSVENFIDIDADTASLFIDGSKVHTWQFSTQANGSSGSPQLGALNIFAEAEQGTPDFYIDNVNYNGATSLIPPTIEISDSIIVNLNGEDTVFTISNVGEQELTFEVYPIYPKDNLNIKQNGSAKEEYLTHVQGNLNAGLGYANPVTLKVAAKFRPNDIKEYIGKEIDKVIFGINDLAVGSNATLMIWDRGNSVVDQPGELIYSKEFQIETQTGLNLVELDSSLYLTGDELWVGYQCENAGNSHYPAGLDEGPKVQGVNFINYENGWHETAAMIDMNLFILCGLVGDTIPKWMTVNQEYGSLLPGTNEDITISFNPTGLAYGVEQHGQLIISSNDYLNPNKIIDVYFTPATPNGYVSTFIVQDSLTAQPIEGVNITINDTTLTTNESGIASLNLHNGSYPYSVNKNGYGSKNDSIVVYYSDTTESIELNFVGYDVTFNINEYNTSSPIQGAEVTFDGSTQTTDASGSTTFNNIQPTTGLYTVAKTGYTTINGSLLVDDNKTLNLLMIPDSITTYSVTFNIDNGTIPIEGAVVQLEGYGQIATDASGEAIFASVATQDYIPYVIVADTYDNYEGTVDVTNSSVVENISLYHYYKVIFGSYSGNGIVEAQIEGASINSGDIVVEGSDIIFTATPDQHYELVDWYIFNQPVGISNLTVEHSNISEDLEIFAEFSPLTYSVTFNIDDGINPILSDATVNLNGIILNSSTGQVTFYNQFPENNVPYTVTAEGYETESGFINIEGNTTINVSLDILTYDATFFVGDGTYPIEGATITLDGYGTLTTSPDGFATFSSIAPETGITYVVNAENYVSETGTIDIINSNITELVSMELETFTATFNVMDLLNNEPIENAEISVNSTAIITNASGIATIDLSNGTYEYVATAVNYNDTTGYITIDNGIISEYVYLRDAEGIEEMLPQGFEFYPVPAQNKITIKSKNNIIALQIYSIQGGLIDKCTVNDNQYTYRFNLPNGIYYLKAIYKKETITKILHIAN